MFRVKTLPAFWLFTVLALTLGFYGCAPPTTEPGGSRPAFDPSRFRGGEIYAISPQASEIRILVYRSGPLARFGHNHVISTRDIRGNIYRHQEPRYSGIVMQLPVTSFEVDDPVLREAAGPAFSTMPSEKDIAGTRNNMFGEQVLNGRQHPYIRLVSVGISGGADHANALMRVTVRGVSTDVNIPVEILYEGQRIIVKGQTEISQTELDMEPFTIMMGAIAVKNEMVVQFHLVAQAI